MNAKVLPDYQRNERRANISSASTVCSSYLKMCNRECLREKQGGKKCFHWTSLASLAVGTWHQVFSACEAPTQSHNFELAVGTETSRAVLHRTFLQRNPTEVTVATQSYTEWLATDNDSSSLLRQLNPQPWDSEAQATPLTTHLSVPSARNGMLKLLVHILRQNSLFSIQHVSASTGCVALLEVTATRPLCLLGCWIVRRNHLVCWQCWSCHTRIVVQHLASVALLSVLLQ